MTQCHSYTHFLYLSVSSTTSCPHGPYLPLFPHPTCLPLITTVQSQYPSRSPPSMQPGVGDPQAQG